MPEQSPILANLLELYIHDFSEIHPVELGADGRFGYVSLPLYWSESGRYPFLLRVDGKWAGFALVKRGSEVSDDQRVWDFAEFFVLRGYRGRGIGTELAQQVWQRLSGSWEVRVMCTNAAAVSFWRRAIATFNGEEIRPIRIERGPRVWEVFRFESTGAVRPSTQVLGGGLQ